MTTTTILTFLLNLGLWSMAGVLTYQRIRDHRAMRRFEADKAADTQATADRDTEIADIHERIAARQAELDALLGHRAETEEGGQQ